MILSPMLSEMNVFQNVLDNTTFHGRTLCQGKIGEQTVAVLNTGMGLVNTALMLSHALDELNPSAVISQGTAGAHVESLNVGDIVCATRFVYGDSVKGEQPLAVEVKNENRYSFDADPRFVEIGKRFGLACGTVLSGYAWRTEKEDILCAHARFESLCEEMEDAAAAQVCYERGIPHGSFRIISNNHLRKDGAYCLSVAEKLQHFLITRIANGELL